MEEDAEAPVQWHDAAETNSDIDPTVKSSVSFGGEDIIEVEAVEPVEPIPENEELELSASVRRAEYEGAENPNADTQFPLRVTESQDLAPEDAQGQKRALEVDVRKSIECDAMSTEERLKRKLGRLCCRKNIPLPAIDENDKIEDEELGGKLKKIQYRVTKAQERHGCLSEWLGCMYDYMCVGNVSMASTKANYMFIYFLNWVFRTSFAVVFLISLIFYLICITFFAALIIAAGELDAQCIVIGSGDYGNENKFTDSFSLAWTTFSTVGYGNTATEVSYQVEKLENCSLVTFICASCSFSGILYAGFCGAVFFSKVTVIQSRARVLFSDPIVIRYGNESNDFVESDDENDEETSDDEAKVPNKIPCPALEFRLVNLLHNQVGGEIMDATLNCTACINAEDVDSAIQNHVTSTNQENQPKHNSRDYQFANWLRGAQLISKKRYSQIEVDEDPSSSLSVKRVFSSLLIEASDHPFFKRVWVARHILDETSPLLTPKARKQVRRNGGFWPEHLNNHAGVRNSLRFNQIVVSLNGVSNISGSSVYTQKIYDFVDVNVGYQFVSILYRGNDNALNVDISLINDVKEQKGGGGEPLNVS